jgi:hypothetical protein
MRAELLRAGAVKRVAILAGVTKVPMMRTGGVAFAGLCTHKTVRAMRKSLVLDGGESVLRQQTGE